MALISSLPFRFSHRYWHTIRRFVWKWLKMDFPPRVDELYHQISAVKYKEINIFWDTCTSSPWHHPHYYHYHYYCYLLLLLLLKWMLPEIGVPLFIIHFRLGLSLKDQPAMGVPPISDTPKSLVHFAPGTFSTWHRSKFTRRSSYHFYPSAGPARKAMDPRSGWVNRGNVSFRWVINGWKAIN